MKITQALKEIRLKRGIKQSDMITNRESSSVYSRIESGKLNIKLDTLIDITNNLGITFEELVKYAEFDSDFLKIKEIVPIAMTQPDNQKIKAEVLEQYYILREKNKKTLIDYSLLYTIINPLLTKYPEITKPTEEECNTIFSLLIKSNFYGHYDLMLATNIVPFFSQDQFEKLVDKIYPLEDITKMSQHTQRYANILLTNIISISVYRMDYRTALKFVEIAEKQDPDYNNYYFHLNIQYHKNIILRFIERDTEYIEKARGILKIMSDIGDIGTAKALTEELNILNETPNYYLDFPYMDENYVIPIHN